MSRIQRTPAEWAKLVGFYLLVAAIIFYAVFPFYYAIISSLKTGTSLFNVDYFPFSFDVTFGNYGTVLETDNSVAIPISMSVLVSGLALLLVGDGVWGLLYRISQRRDSLPTKVARWLVSFAARDPESTESSNLKAKVAWWLRRRAVLLLIIFAASLLAGDREAKFTYNILNSIGVSLFVVGMSLLLGLTAAFALARVRFRGRGALMLTILAVSMFPQVAVLSGMLELINYFGINNSLWSLVFAYMIFTLPFTVWVLTTFMRGLPLELEEAAIMDGATPWVIITKVFMPLMWPALVTTGLLAFIAAWNEFLFALMFTQTGDKYTVPVAIANMSGASQFELPWGNIMAASVVVTVPVVLLVLVFQRRIVAGLTDGAVKG